jgi:phosphoenolpyruvate-protein phosphotransferase (PTS system enzyme I)
MAFIIHGIGVSDGIAIGHAHLMTGGSLEVDHFQIPREFIAREVKRFDRAVKQVREELETLQKSVKDDAPAELAAFVGMHRMILDDPMISDAPRDLIREQACNAEWALKVELDAMLAEFEDVQDEYLRERKSDVRQVVERILNALSGQGYVVPDKLQTRAEDTILVAYDLSPADVIVFKDHQISAFITDLGGATSHTAILARSLGIPSILALHHARELIHEDELIIVDGTQGVVIVDPSPTILAEYKLKQNQYAIERQKLKRIKTAPTRTLDGMDVELLANIELPGDIDQVKSCGANGVGLFRSEFLFLNRRDLPGEDEQYEAYRAVAEGLKGLPVTIRTLDIGADKALEADKDQEVMPNPALGLRAIRYCLAEPQLFNTQLRAILRASRHGKIQLLIPMLSSLDELNQALTAIAYAKEQLKDEGKKFDEAIKVGGMIEIPAAALTLPMLLPKLDFISIGTNDLIQYTLAIDRSDDAVAHLYDPLHPAVLYLVSNSIRLAHAAGKPVTICGEMAGDVDKTRLLLGFGLRSFSMHPANLLTVKQRVLMSNLHEAESISAKVLKADSPERLFMLLDKLNA